MRLKRISSRAARPLQSKDAQSTTLLEPSARAMHVQTKLRVGAANDAAEREADRTAQRVLALLRAPTTTDPKATESHAAIKRDVGRLRRAATSTASVAPEGGMVDASLESGINNARRSGRPLDPAVQHSMGEGFGADFGNVRVHTGAQADGLNQALQSRAFTIGNDIFFAGSEYAPGTAGGQQLLAHELTHTLQQGGDATASRMIRRWVLAPNVDLTDAIDVGTINSGEPVFFLEDAAHDTLVVKGDRVPVGMNQLFNEIHQQVSGTRTISIELLPTKEKMTMKNMIRAKGNSSTWDALYATKQSSIDPIVAYPSPANLAYFSGVAPATPRGKAQLFLMERLDGEPKLVAMTNAGAGGATRVDNVMGTNVAEGSKNARQLFSDPQHMRELGILTATDLFLGNQDRVVWGNFKNWFVDPSGAITLIDSLDAGAKGEMITGDVATGAMRMLAKGAIAKTARDAVTTLINGMVAQGDSGATVWANNLTGDKTIRTIMEQAFLNGLNDGKARIVKIYASDKKKATGRAAKQKATATQGADTNVGDTTQQDYWVTLKARARWLKAH